MILHGATEGPDSEGLKSGSVPALMGVHVKHLERSWEDGLCSSQPHVVGPGVLLAISAVGISPSLPYCPVWLPQTMVWHAFARGREGVEVALQENVWVSQEMRTMWLLCHSLGSWKYMKDRYSLLSFQCMPGGALTNGKAVARSSLAGLRSTSFNAAMVKNPRERVAFF